MPDVVPIHGRERSPIVIRSGLEVTASQIAGTLGIANVSSIETTGNLTEIRPPFLIDPNPDLEGLMDLATRRLTFNAGGEVREINMAFTFLVLDGTQRRVTVVEPMMRESRTSNCYELGKEQVRAFTLDQTTDPNVKRASVLANRGIGLLHLKYQDAIRRGFV